MNGAAILINVDDVEAERSARNAVLSSAGFLVHDAATGQQALDLVEEHHPDLVLVHLRNGHDNQICSRLKLAPHGAAVAVLQICATAAMSRGADACLTEPVDAAVLVATIRGMLRLREAERALAEANDRLETANQELRRSNENFQHFAFVASHDLQEPLRTVTTFLELIEQDAQDRLTETEKDYFAHVVAGANRMRNLINDLLAYSQIGRE